MKRPYRNVLLLGGIVAIGLILRATWTSDPLVEPLMAIPESTPPAPVEQGPQAPGPDITNETIATRFSCPEGFERTPAQSGTFADFLRNLPVQPAGSPVLLFNGQPKHRQDVHAAVVDMDIGSRDLQQCADAVIRLRAEYFWAQEAYDQISFHFTNGFAAPYARWRNGERIRVEGNTVSWQSAGGKRESYSDFRKYLNLVFAYAGTRSLDKELHPTRLESIAIGDVLIRGGSPGHAVIVVDKARNPETGEELVLLAQSYMPAQHIHILKNPNSRSLSPWYAVQTFATGIRTPEWDFQASELKTFVAP